MKLECIYADLPGDVKRRLNSSSYEFERPLPKGKIKKTIGLMKNELCEKIMTQTLAMTPKTYNYLKNRCFVDKKPKETKNCLI